jgi:hypothetical protein
VLWESKNAKWQKPWIEKIKDDMREAKAAVGIIVSRELPEEYGEMHHIEGNVWAVKPRHVPAIASALRLALIQVCAAHKSAENKGGKMEVLYQFLTGTEFRNRIEVIVQNYRNLQKELEKERSSAQARWARQEKAIRAVIDNTFGLYGDLQGITDNSVMKIPLLEEEDGENTTFPA